MTQPASRSEVIAMMRDHGVTPTQQRVDIAQILFEKAQHLSAEQILSRVNEQDALVSKATVYNTLKLFAQKGLVREVIVDPSKVFYDSTTRPHHHFYNVDTGTLTDIDEDEVALGELPSLPQGTVADGVDVIVRIRNRGEAS